MERRQRLVNELLQGPESGWFQKVWVGVDMEVIDMLCYNSRATKL